MNGLLIKQNSKENIFLGFKSKIELKKNNFYQKVLQDYHSSFDYKNMNNYCYSAFAEQ